MSGGIMECIMNAGEPTVVTETSITMDFLDELILDVIPFNVRWFNLHGEWYKSHSGKVFRCIEVGEYQGKSFEVYEEVKNFKLVI